METRNTPSVMLPLLVILALLYPVANMLRPPGSGDDGTRGGEAVPPEGNAQEAREEAAKLKPAHDAANLLNDFFGPMASEKSFTLGYRLDFIVASIPDPVASRLPYFFDSFADSIQRGVEAADYVLDRFDLPWTERIPEAGKARFETEPGLVLFRHRDPVEKKLLLLFLVGETPTTGLHKPAFAGALDQISRELYGWNGQEPAVHVSLPETGSPGNHTIKILGPSFSGSAVSMKLALNGWLKETRSYHPAPGIHFQIVSGTATAMNKVWFAAVESGGASFKATVPPDPPVLDAFVRQLEESEAHGIALLAEGNTVYGQFLKTRSTSILTLPFPLHISNLRAAAEKEKQSRQATAPQQSNQRPASLPLPQEEGAEPRETLPGFSPLSTPSADLVLSNLLSTISREKYRYVGILATDVQDTIFLAEQIHEHCPATVTFTFNPDLLYTHPQASPSTQGMLMITPYPLFTLNQVWTSPFTGGDSRLQFPNQAAEGVYNATLALLGQEGKIVEYGIPFDTGSVGPRRPAAWVTVVGRNGMLPVTYLDWQDNDDYSLSLPGAQVSVNSRGEPKTASMRGVYTRGTVIAVIALSICFILFSGLIIEQYPLRGARRPDGRVSRLIGDTVTEEYRSRCRLFLLAGCIIMMTFYVVVMGAFFLPAFACLKLRLADAPTGMLVIVVPVSALTAWMLARAVYQIAVAFKAVPWPSSGMAVVVVWAIIGSCSIVLLCALWLVGAWLTPIGKRPANLIFTYLRAFSLGSGFSPLVPLFCITAAALLWAIGSFRRMRLIDVLQPAEESEKGVKLSGFLSLDCSSFKGIREMEGQVEYFLSSASVMSPLSYILLFSVAFSAAFYSFRTWMVVSFEGTPFYRLFQVSFFLVYWALLMEFLRLALIWHRLRQFMRRLSWHPMRAAYKRYRGNFPSMPKINLMTMPRYIALEFSVEQARDLLRLAGVSEQPAEPPADEAPVQAGTPAASLEVEKKPSTSQAEKPGLFRNRLVEWARNAEPEVERAGAGLADALEMEARELSAEKTKEEETGYSWRESIRHQRRARAALAQVTRSLGEVMESYWVPATGEPSRTTPTAGEMKFFTLAEEFIAGRAVHFLSCIFPALKNLGELVLGGLLLMLLAVTSYAFPARDQFLLFNWTVILVFIGVAATILVQMERDVVLSALNDTTPGQVTLNREFVFRIFIYVVLPILALLGAQFPDTLGRLLSAVGATQGGGP